MAITLRTVADTAPVDLSVQLVATIDEGDLDTEFTWKANPPTGVTWGDGSSGSNKSRLTGTRTTEITLTVASANAGAIEISLHGNVHTTETTPKEITFMDFDPNTAVSLVSDQQLVLPGTANDAAHSPLYTTTVEQTPNDITSAVPGVEIQWSVDPLVNFTVYDMTNGNVPVDPITGASTYYVTKADATTGEASIRIITDHIVKLTVTAITLGVESQDVTEAYYATVDKNSSEWKKLKSDGKGPHTDNPVDFTGTVNFSATMSSLGAPLNNATTAADWTGFMVLDGNGSHIAAKWDSMAEIFTPPPVALVPNARASSHKENHMGLFIQNLTSGDVNSYWIWDFNAAGYYLNQPRPDVSRVSDWYPTVADRVPGGQINNTYIKNHKGIPLSITFDPGSTYDDGSWYIYFEWFLNNGDLTKTDYQFSPLSVNQSTLQIVSGSQTYTDTLPANLLSGYTGLGTLYVDFYLGKLVDVESERIYSNWDHQGYILSTT